MAAKTPLKKKAHENERNSKALLENSSLFALTSSRASSVQSTFHRYQLLQTELFLTEILFLRLKLENNKVEIILWFDQFLFLNESKLKLIQ